MLKNIFQNSFSHSCFKISSFIRHLVLIHLLRIKFMKEKIDTSLKLLGLYCFKCTCQSIFGPMLFPRLVTTCILINWMPSSVLNWDTSFQSPFPNKSLFPIKPRIFGCTCFVWDVRLHVPKLNPKSLECIFLGYSRVQKGYRCYCRSLRGYLVSADVSFLENAPFSPSPIHTSQGEDDDLLIYTIASPHPALVKPLITQVYTRRQNPPVSSPTPTASTSNPVLSDDLPIALRKVKH